MFTLLTTLAALATAESPRSLATLCAYDLAARLDAVGARDLALRCAEGPDADWRALANAAWSLGTLPSRGAETAALRVACEAMARGDHRAAALSLATGARWVADRNAELDALYLCDNAFVAIEQNTRGTWVAMRDGRAIATGPTLGACARAADDVLGLTRADRADEAA